MAVLGDEMRREIHQLGLIRKKDSEATLVNNSTTELSYFVESRWTLKLKVIIMSSWAWANHAASGREHSNFEIATSPNTVFFVGSTCVSMFGAV